VTINMLVGAAKIVGSSVLGAWAGSSVGFALYSKPSDVGGGGYYYLKCEALAVLVESVALRVFFNPPNWAYGLLAGVHGFLIFQQIITSYHHDNVKATETFAKV
jgi:hypothetical protein